MKDIRWILLHRAGTTHPIHVLAHVPCSGCYFQVNQYSKSLPFTPYEGPVAIQKVLVGDTHETLRT